MPFLRAPVSRSEKVRRGPAFYLVVLVMPLCALGVGAGYGISRLLMARRAWIERTAGQVALMRLRYHDLVDRHPDLELPAQRAALESFLASPLARQGRELDQGLALLATLRDGCATGVDGAVELDASRTGDPRYKTFSPNGFRLFYDGLAQEEVGPPIGGAPITGLAAADARIATIAEGRGYRLRPVADESLLVREGGNETHAAALDSFHAMREAAHAFGIELGIVSAYRSVELQRLIFMDRLALAARSSRGRTISAAEIAHGEADDLVQEVLVTSSIPGYSKHHSGYAMDLEDASSGYSFLDFDRSPAHVWLSAGNYHNAKRFGFIPSYPPGASEQGPDPETWEYVWVGEELLREDW